MSSGAILDNEGTEALCIDSCYSSLESARTVIAGACTAKTDVIVEEELAYPGIHLRFSFSLTFVFLQVYLSYLLRRQLHLYIQCVLPKGQVRICKDVHHFIRHLLMTPIASLGSTATHSFLLGQIRATLPAIKAVLTVGLVSWPYS